MSANRWSIEELIPHRDVLGEPFGEALERVAATRVLAHHGQREAMPVPDESLATAQLRLHRSDGLVGSARDDAIGREERLEARPIVALERHDLDAEPYHG